MSGTYIKAVASISSTVGLRSFQITINGTTVKSGTFSSPYPPGIQATVYWDSTHFASGTSVTVQAQGTDSSGSQSAQFSVTTYNKAYVLGNSTLSYGSTADGYIAARTGEMNHATTSSTADRKTTILSGLPTYTVFYIYTHGAIGLFGDC
ncbi:MAG: hypothetical protein C4321_04540 [Chloroflexota bacterium]